MVGLENTMHKNGDAVSEVTAEILMIGLVTILGAVVLVMVFGVMPLIPKTSYLATDISLTEMPGYSAIAIHHRGGDPLNFTRAAGVPGAALITIITPAGTYPVVPDAGFLVFKPGDTVYVYYTGTGYHLVANISGVTAVPLPATGLRLTIVDLTSGLLIQEWQLMPSGIPVPSTTAVTPTLTPAPTATTTTAITTTTTTTTTTTPTPTTTTPAPGTISITISWAPNGLGYISIAPPTPLSNPGTVAVTSGSSQTFSFVPREVANKAVKTIVVDGTTVYTGSSNNTTITYTLMNVVAPHTIAATFG
ncbi:MAG: type IV pilin [Methanoregula sp.]|nr:type IV pilin [Methanoregula sp.]